MNNHAAAPINAITGQVVDAALAVHRAFGPGLLESAYKACLVHELRLRGLSIQTEVPVPIEYRGLWIAVAYRLDLLVDGRVIVELKAATHQHAAHEAQLLTLLRLMNVRIGLLINFNVVRLKDGISRKINDYRRPPTSRSENTLIGTEKAQEPVDSAHDM